MCNRKTENIRSCDFVVVVVRNRRTIVYSENVSVHVQSRRRQRNHLSSNVCVIDRIGFKCIKHQIYCAFFSLATKYTENVLERRFFRAKKKKKGPDEYINVFCVRWKTFC